jgi:hypothetical protein
VHTGTAFFDFTKAGGNTHPGHIFSLVIHFLCLVVAFEASVVFIGFWFAYTQALDVLSFPHLRGLAFGAGPGRITLERCRQSLTAMSGRAFLVLLSFQSLIIFNVVNGGRFRRQITTELACPLF